MEEKDISMKDRICIVTGATAGIGLATAWGLAEKGATVVLVGRDAQKSAAAVAHIQQGTGNGRVSSLLADLSVQSQVRSLAQEFEGRFDRLGVLVNNAAGYFHRRHESADGLESTWALNVLSPFLLTHLLLDRLAASAPARIVNVSSDVHRIARIHWDDLEGRQRYSWLRAYSQSKLALVLLTYELARRLDGTGVTANALHPGIVATKLFRGDAWGLRLARPVMRRLLASPKEGAQTSIYLASSPEVAAVTGKYFKEGREAPSAPRSYDREAAQRLWQVCSDQTGS